MKLRVGYELQYEFSQATPVIMMLHIHDTRICDLEKPDRIVVTPTVPISDYRDIFRNRCARLFAPPGAVRISTDTVIRDTGAKRWAIRRRMRGGGRTCTPSARPLRLVTVGTGASLVPANQMHPELFLNSEQ